MDKDSGRLKGFAFCEFFDVWVAESAVRNLQGHDLAGRSLRLDYAEDDRERFGRPTGFKGGPPPRGPGGGPGGGPGSAPVGRPAAAMAAQQMSLMLGGPPVIAPGGSTDKVTNTLAGMSRQQLFDIMVQMKALIGANPGQARQVLIGAPQLTRALFQAQILLGMVRAPEVPPHLVQQQAAMAGGVTMGGLPPPPPPPAMAAAAAAGASAAMPMGYQPPGMAGYPAQAYPGMVAAPAAPAVAPYGMQQQPPAAAPGLMGMQPGMPLMAGGQPALGALGQPQQQPPLGGYPGLVGVPGAPALPAAAPAAAPLAAPQLGAEQQKALLSKIMMLTPEQIQLLPEAQKAQVLALQAQMVSVGLSLGWLPCDHLPPLCLMTPCALYFVLFAAGRPRDVAPESPLAMSMLRACVQATVHRCCCWKVAILMCQLRHKHARHMSCVS